MGEFHPGRFDHARCTSFLSFVDPVLCAVGLACALQGEVQAADGGPRDVATAPRVFDIAPGELAEVLLNIVRQGHVPIAFDQRLVAGLRGPDIRGRLSVEEALRRALAGSGLAYAQDESGAFVLRRGQAPVQETRGATVAPTLSTVVVTGTRKSDVKAQDSLSPIDVVSATQLRSSGAVDLRDALVKLLPSLTRQAQPFNASALTHTQSLRGLSPNHVLVLVNGKRRHETANLNISGGLEKGSTGVDLDTIPINAIERVEVLRDGASAQYGSDAIAGVINVILKSADSGGSAAADVGQTGDGDGFTHGGGGTSGWPSAIAASSTSPPNIASRSARCAAASMSAPVGATIFPWAIPRSTGNRWRSTPGFGLGDDIEVYGFGTYTRRKASSAANYRLASVAPTLYPDGFTPRPNSDEDDYAFLAGVRGERLLDAWHWDLSSGYGADRPDIGMTQSVNAAIYRETGNSPRSFDLARYRNSQWTSNLDLGREFELDFLAAPLALSLGAEYRRESYRIDAGDPASYYSGGAESLAGLSPLSEGQWSRHAWASYLDLGTSLTPAWEVDVAVRHEKFSDFGSTTNGKFATRYQFDPRVALRASVSSGFRAPSLVQEHYTGLSVGPTIALGLLAANSPAAKMLGADELQPEKSTSFNLGLVLSPWENVGLNIDAYQISIRDRIVDSATYSGQEAIDALAAAGISLPASASTVSTPLPGQRCRHPHPRCRHHRSLPRRAWRVRAGRLGTVGQLQPHHLAQEPSRRQRRAAAQCPAGRLDHQLHPAQPGFPSAAPGAARTGRSACA